MPHLLDFGSLRSVVLFALMAFAVISSRAQQVTSPSTHNVQQLRGRVSLHSGERFCTPVPLKPSRTINLGAGQLTVTFSSEKKQAEDVMLVAKLTAPQVTLTKADTNVELCGAVPSLSRKQLGEYGASDYAIHFGSGNVTNIGTPDDNLVNTEALTAQLQAVRLTLLP